VVWLASSPTYVVCGNACSCAESEREFGGGADDCVSSAASVCTASAETTEPTRSENRAGFKQVALEILGLDG